MATTRLNLPVHGVCGKKRHYTRAAAEGHKAALARWERMCGRADIELLRVYRCRSCEAWHVGHGWASAQPP